jgi:two-component system chemotaxis response regulator CheV
MASNRILLESGTNEVEIIEFMLGEQSFGVNVAKVREIVPYNPQAITAVPESYPSVLGMFILRDSTIPLIDLSHHLAVDEHRTVEGHQVVMVCEFNEMVNGFLVDGVNQIHRCSWNEISPISSYISQHGPSVTSSVKIDERNILLIDLEHIIADIYPETRMVYHEEEDPQHAKNIEQAHEDRHKVKVIVAEDSPIVRASVKKVLSETGYTDLELFDNGLDAYEKVVEYHDRAKREGRPINDLLQVVVTDIEMPRMDGLTMCRKIKQELRLTSLPVIVFSSLINDQMIGKCKSVGADDYAHKLKIEDLVHILDRHVLRKGEA